MEATPLPLRRWLTGFCTSTGKTHCDQFHSGLSLFAIALGQTPVNHLRRGGGVGADSCLGPKAKKHQHRGMLVLIVRFGFAIGHAKSGSTTGDGDGRAGDQVTARVAIAIIRRI